MTEDDKQKQKRTIKAPYIEGKISVEAGSLVGSKGNRQNKVDPAKEHHFAHVETDEQ